MSEAEASSTQNQLNVALDEFRAQVQVCHEQRTEILPDLI